jgi:nucleotide-binding universal stress UspA family protein
MEVLMTGPVVVGVNGAQAEPTLAYGAALARALNVEVVPVHAVEDPLAFPYGNAELRELLRRKALAAGEAFVADAGERTGIATGEARIVLGEPETALRTVAQEVGAGLIVVAPRRRSRFARALVPGVASSLVREAPSPVVVVPPDAQVEAMRLVDGAPVVVGADGSEASDRAVAVARSLAMRLDSPVLPVGIDVANAAEDALRYRNVHPRPGQALAEVAHRARSALLVVGTAGGSERSGSVAQRLIAAAPVPLVVVRDVGAGARA